MSDDYSAMFQEIHQHMMCFNETRAAEIGFYPGLNH